MNTNSCTILLAPQAYKGTYSALQVAAGMESGVRRVMPQANLIVLPVADGGDGTLDVLMQARPGTLQSTSIMGPLGEDRQAAWGLWNDRTAVIETALICGLRIIPDGRLNPAIATTFGCGQVIHAALEMGIRKFIIGLGGSATHDGGAGLAQALGTRFLDRNGTELPLGGLAIRELHSIHLEKLDPRLKESSIIALCDCRNPLTGPDGASLYAPQKGATPDQVQQLEEAMVQFARVIKHDLSFDIATFQGGGAAGGTAAGLAVLGAKLVPGIDTILKLIEFDEALKQADLVITGEGRMDRQTAFNKAPMGVAKAAKAAHVPVLAIVGGLGEGYEALHDVIDAIIPLSFLPIQGQPDNLNQISEATEQALRCAKLLKSS